MHRIKRRVMALLGTDIIIRELFQMRAATQHLTTAVEALATSVQAATAKINEEVEALKTAHTDGDDAEVEAIVGRITSLTGNLDSAVQAATSAVQATPADAPGAGPVADPAAGGQPQS